MSGEPKSLVVDVELLKLEETEGSIDVEEILSVCLVGLRMRVVGLVVIKVVEGGVVGGSGVIVVVDVEEVVLDDDVEKVDSVEVDEVCGEVFVGLIMPNLILS